MNEDVALFEQHRSSLLALAYRMLGDLSRAEDIVQEAWLRWERREQEIVSPKSYLVTIVTRLCLNELDSARARREEARSDRLPEPLDLRANGFDKIDAIDRISLAFLVLLQRLTPLERAVLLLHDVFDFEHTEVAALLEKSEQASRQLLSRAKKHVASERRALAVSHEAHRRLLRAFLVAASSGDVEGVASLLTEDALLIADAGPEGGNYGRVKNLPGPITGAKKVAAFAARVTPQGAAGLTTEERELNGQPAILVLRDGEPYTAIFLSVLDEKIRAIFIQADPAKIKRTGSSDRTTTPRADPTAEPDPAGRGNPCC